MTHFSRSVILDCEALSGLLRKNRAVTARIRAAQSDGARMLTSTMTVVEAAGAKIEAGHLGWALSGLSVVPVTEDDALTAHRLLSENGMHGHKYAIDGVVAALALRSPGPVAVLTSDPNDMAALCGPKVHVVRI